LFQRGSQEYQRIRMKTIDIITFGHLLILNFRKIYHPNHSVYSSDKFGFEPQTPGVASQMGFHRSHRRCK